MKKLNKFLLIFCMLFMIVNISTILLHELAHYIVAKIYTNDVKYTSNYVNFNSNILDAKQLFLINIIGPIFSLLLGSISYILYKKQKIKILRSLFYWFGLHNVCFFIGYCILGVFIKNSDMGYVYNFLSINIFIKIIIVFISIMLLKKQYKMATEEFLLYRQKKELNKKNLGKYIFIYPIAIYIIIMLIINTNSNIISILPIVSLPLSYISIYKSYMKNDKNIDNIIYIEEKYFFVLMAFNLIILLTYIILKS